MPKKLIVIPNWIGDCVLALSVIIKKAENEDADLTLLVPPNLVSLCAEFTTLPIIPYSRKTHKEFLATLSEIKSGNFPFIYVLPHSFSSGWLAFRSGIQKRRGVSREIRGMFFNDVLPLSTRNKVHHILAEYAKVLETGFFSPETWQGVKIDKPTMHADSIVLCPGSKYGPTKKWPLFGELIDKLPTSNILLLGDKDEQETGAAIESIYKHRVVNLIGKTSLLEAVSIISASRLVIANDSGLMHVAGFVGTPVVGIFGSTSAIWTRPLGTKNRIAETKCPCSPCFEKKCRYGHYNCLKNISVDYVAGLARELL